MLDIYWALMPADYDDEPIYPPKRQEAIDCTKNPAVRRERYFAWKLLEHGLKQSLGKSIMEIDPYVSADGKWLSDSCFFSISHSNDAVAVAISDSPVGIDIERKREIDHDAFSRRILTNLEQRELKARANKNDFILELWTKKESIYKMIGKPPFVPSRLECNEYTTSTFSEKIGDNDYIISVCSDEINDASIIEYKL